MLNGVRAGCVGVSRRDAYADAIPGGGCALATSSTGPSPQVCRGFFVTQRRRASGVSVSRWPSTGPIPLPVTT